MQHDNHWDKLVIRIQEITINHRKLYNNNNSTDLVLRVKPTVLVQNWSISVELNLNGSFITRDSTESSVFLHF